MSRLARRLALTAALVGAAIAAGGCGITDPYHHAPSGPSSLQTTTHAATTTSPRTAIAQDPSEPPPGKSTTTARRGVTAAPTTPGASTPQTALERYTRLYINWSAATIGQHQRQLAAWSEGTARARALQAAASYGRDPLLRNGRASNRGQVISIAKGEGPQRGWWVIVTREHTTGHGDYQGLPATAHVTYAQLAHTSHGWVVSEWSPQN